MKTISLEDAVYYIKQSRGILLEGRFIEPYLFDIEEDYENTFMILEWEELIDNVGYIVTVEFKEKDNQIIATEDGVLMFINADGEEEEVTLVREWNPFD